MKIPLTFARGVTLPLGFKAAMVFAALLSASLPAGAESGETAQVPKEFRTAIIYDDLFSKRTYEVAVGAVAGSLTAVDLVIEGRVKNAFAALRPPGHHAMPDKAKGFCYFSNSHCLRAATASGR